MDDGGLKFDRIWAAEQTVVHDLVPRHHRRLSDKVLVVFHHACDAGDFEAAAQLLNVLETLTTRRPRSEQGERRLNFEGLVGAHERLWRLQHPGRE